MATFFSGGTIWCSAGSTATSVRIDGKKIVEVNGSAHPADDLVDLRGGFLAPALGWSPQESISVEESLGFIPKPWPIKDLTRSVSAGSQLGCRQI